jgi:hypothetical protein
MPSASCRRPLAAWPSSPARGFPVHYICHFPGKGFIAAEPPVRDDRSRLILPNSQAHDTRTRLFRDSLEAQEMEWQIMLERYPEFALNWQETGRHLFRTLSAVSPTLAQIPSGQLDLLRPCSRRRSAARHAIARPANRYTLRIRESFLSR